jgi:Ca2+-binding RTX toxin-like protein
VVDAMVNSSQAAVGTNATTIANSFETLNITATDGSATAFTQLNMDASQITNGALNVAVTAGAGADTIIGGAGNDTIANVGTGTAASAADVLTGGTGNDTFVLRGDTASGLVSTIAGATSFVTDFTVGATPTTTDILQLSATSANYANAVTGGSALFTGVSAAAAGATAIQNVAQNAAAAAIVAGTDMLKLTTGVATAGITLQAAFNAAIGTATITGLGAKDAIFATIYDITNGRMDILTVNATNGTNTVVETGDVVSLVGTVTMSAADYASFSANNLSIIAA